MSRRWDVRLDEYEISAYAYRELKYFCLQYREKKDRLDAIRGLKARPVSSTPSGSSSASPVEAKAIKAERLASEIELIESTVREVGADIYKWLLESVTTEGVSWYVLSRRLDKVPMSKNPFYLRRRMFFKRLAEKKGLE